MEFRRKLGEILEGVFYRGDEVNVERNGRLMAVIVSPERYQQLSEGRQRLREMFEEVWERNRDIPPEEADRIAEEAVRWARRGGGKSGKRKIAS